MSTGRWAGFTYLFLVAAGIFSIAYAPGRYIVDGDAAATFARLAADPIFFTNAIVAELACYSSFVLLAVLLHRVFQERSQTLALAMVALVLVSVPIGFLAVGEKLAALHLVAQGPAQTSAIDAHFVRYGDLRTLAEVFWGLWLLPYGLLVLKSRAIPRVFGVLLILGCFSYVAGVIAPLYWSGYFESPLGRYASIPRPLGEIGSALWLTVFGASSRNTG